MSRLSQLLGQLSSRDNEQAGEEAYLNARSEAGLLLDLVGTLQVEEGRPMLTAAALHRDAWLALWGALGLVRLGAAAPADAFERAAADPEVQDRCCSINSNSWGSPNFSRPDTAPRTRLRNPTWFAG